MSLRIVLACLLVWGVLGGLGYWWMSGPGHAQPGLELPGAQPGVEHGAQDSSLLHPAAEAHPPRSPYPDQPHATPDAPGLQIEAGTAEGSQVVLDSDHTLGGKVVARDGTPLPGVALEAEWISEDADYIEHETRSGAGGVFGFASLGPWPYRIRCRIVQGDDREHQPNRRGIVIRSTYPTATIRVLHADGRPIPGQAASISPATRAGDGVRLEKGGTRDSWIYGDARYVAFQSSGLHSIHSVSVVDQVRYSASALVDVGARHAQIELLLAPEVRVIRPVEVIGPNGEPVTDYRVTVESAGDGTYIGYARSPECELQARAGPARFTVTTQGSTYVLPFQVNGEINDEPGPLVLQGSELGGHLQLDCRLEGDPIETGRATITDADQQQIKAVAIENGRVVTSRPIPAGTYKVKLTGTGHYHHFEVMEVKTGRTTTATAHLTKL